MRFSSSPLTATPYSRAPLGSTDIVTHLGICSSTDPGSANRFLVSDFVTASQAQRKFFSKVVSKITKGSYRLGAVRLISRTLFMNPKLMNFSFLDFSGFCQHCEYSLSRSSGCRTDTLLRRQIVQDRHTGALLEEKIAVYVRFLPFDYLIVSSAY